MMKSIKRLFVVTLVAASVGCAAPAPYDQKIEGIVLRGENGVGDVKVRFLSTNPEDTCDAPGIEAITDKAGKFSLDQKYIPSFPEKYVVAIHPYRLCIFIDSRWQKAWSLKTGPAPRSIVFKCFIAENNKKIEKCLVSWNSQAFM